MPINPALILFSRVQGVSTLTRSSILAICITPVMVIKVPIALKTNLVLLSPSFLISFTSLILASTITSVFYEFEIIVLIVNESLLFIKIGDTIISFPLI